MASAFLRPFLETLFQELVRSMAYPKTASQKCDAHEVRAVTLRETSMACPLEKMLHA